MGRGPGVRATSATSIQIDFRYRGKRCRERISLPPTPANLKYAQRLKATIEHEIATNTFVYAKHFPESPRARELSGTKLRTSLLAYCATLDGQLEPETVDEYRHDVEIICKGLGEDASLETLTRAEVRTWVSTLRLSKKRIDNLLIPLRGALNQMVDDDPLKHNVLAGFKIRRVGTVTPTDTIDPFTPAEIDALSKTSLGDLWSFWTWSGLRSGEIIGLEREFVFLDTNRIKVRKSVRVGREKLPKTKAGSRTLRLLPGAAEPLRRVVAKISAADEVAAVFRNPNTDVGWYEDRALARALRRDCKAAGVRYRYPYQFRHTFATWSLSSGENPAWAANYMGHKDMLTFFKIYAKWMPSLYPTAGEKMVSAVKSHAA